MIIAGFIIEKQIQNIIFGFNILVFTERDGLRIRQRRKNGDLVVDGGGRKGMKETDMCRELVPIGTGCVEHEQIRPVSLGRKQVEPFHQGDGSAASLEGSDHKKYMHRIAPIRLSYRSVSDNERERAATFADLP